MCQPNCGMCRFWDADGSRQTRVVEDGRIEEILMGICHRNPPTTNGHFAYFPKTASISWCGEFKKRKEEGK